MPTIADFKSQIALGGARSNQFTIELSFPQVVNGGDASRTASFLCNATSLPAVTIGNLTLPYRGRPVNFAGEREFAPWSITIINDNDFKIRNVMEQWSHAIANFDQTDGTILPSFYQSPLKVFQLNRNGAPIKSYKFYDAYPTEVSQITLSYDNPNIETFDVTFQYNWYRPEDIPTNTGD